MPRRRNHRIKDIEALLELFRLERYSIVAVSFLSLVLLGTLSVVLLVFYASNRSPHETITVVIGMFAPGGAITYAGSRLLSMWNGALELLLDDEPNADE